MHACQEYTVLLLIAGEFHLLLVCFAIVIFVVAVSLKPQLFCCASSSSSPCSVPVVGAAAPLLFKQQAWPPSCQEGEEEEGVVDHGKILSPPWILSLTGGRTRRRRRRRRRVSGTLTRGHPPRLGASQASGFASQGGEVVASGPSCAKGVVQTLPVPLT